MSSATFSSPIPPVEPKVYETIFGHRCKHSFKKGGVGTTTLLAHVDGMYTEGRAFTSRNLAIQAVFEAFLRFKDRDLAQKTYAIIDWIFPDSPQHPRFDQDRDARLEALRLSLGSVATIAECQGLVSAVEKEEFRPEDVPYIHDVDRLVTNLSAPDVGVRLACVQAIAKLPPQQRWRAMEAALSNDQKTVLLAAAETVIAEKYLPLLPRVIKLRLDEPRSRFQSKLQSFSASLTDEQIHDLLALDDEDVDRFCFEVIRNGNKFVFLDDILAKLNSRESTQAVDTIHSLIQGPWPFDPFVGLQILGRDPKDPWARVTPRDGSVSDLTRFVSSWSDPKVAFKQDQAQVMAVMGAVKSAGLRKDPEMWNIMKQAYENWARVPLAHEHLTTLLAWSMYQSRPEETYNLLLTALHSSDYLPRYYAMLSIGFIGSSRFLPSLQKFPSQNLDTTFQRTYPFALHRCYGRHRWELTKGPDGKYLIRKGQVGDN